MKNSVLQGIIVMIFVICFVKGDFNWDKIDKNSEAFKCHQRGFNFSAIDDEMKMAYKKCADMMIKNRNCLVSCFMQEYGLVKDNKWQDDKAKSALNKVWDKTQPNQDVLYERLWKSSRKCLTEFEMSEKMYPTDYTGDCNAIVSLEECAMKARKCPRL